MTPPVSETSLTSLVDSIRALNVNDLRNLIASGISLMRRKSRNAQNKRAQEQNLRNEMDSTTDEISRLKKGIRLEDVTSYRNREEYGFKNATLSLNKSRESETQLNVMLKRLLNLLNDDTADLINENSPRTAMVQGVDELKSMLADQKADAARNQMLLRTGFGKNEILHHHRKVQLQNTLEALSKMQILGRIFRYVSAVITPLASALTVPLPMLATIITPLTSSLLQFSQTLWTKPSREKLQDSQTKLPQIDRMEQAETSHQQKMRQSLNHQEQAQARLKERVKELFETQSVIP